MASELPSHRVSLTSSSTEKAKNYIQNREIPQLFEALMTGLMFKQPDDHIDYIINCLHKIKSPNSQKNQVKWNTFITAVGEKENANPMNLSREARLVSGNK